MHDKEIFHGRADHLLASKKLSRLLADLDNVQGSVEGYREGEQAKEVDARHRREVGVFDETASGGLRGLVRWIVKSESKQLFGKLKI